MLGNCDTRSEPSFGQATVPSLKPCCAQVPHNWMVLLLENLFLEFRKLQTGLFGRPIKLKKLPKEVRADSSFFTYEKLLTPIGTFHLSVDFGAVMIGKHFCVR